MTEQVEHTGQHAAGNGCGKCNGWRYDRMLERKAAAAAGEQPEADRKVEAEDGWRWQRADDNVTDADAKWANRVLERGFRGSQRAFNEGLATPGQVGITDFIVGLLVAQARPDVGKRIIRGMERGASADSGKPAEVFEREMREAADDLHPQFGERHVTYEVGCANCGQLWDYRTDEEAQQAQERNGVAAMADNLRALGYVVYKRPRFRSGRVRLANGTVLEQTTLEQAQQEPGEPGSAVERGTGNPPATRTAAQPSTGQG